MATLVERTGRFLVLVPLTGRDSLTVEITAALRDALVTDEELAPADEWEFVDPFAEWHDEVEESWSRAPTSGGAADVAVAPERFALPAGG